MSLKWAVEKLRDGAADWLHARNNTIPVNIEWNVDDSTKNAEFKPKSNSSEVGLCVLVADLQAAFNDANPDKSVKIAVSMTTIKVDLATKGQSDDDCTRTP